MGKQILTNRSDHSFSHLIAIEFHTFITPHLFFHFHISTFFTLSHLFSVFKFQKLILQLVEGNTEREKIFTNNTIVFQKVR